MKIISKAILPSFLLLCLQNPVVAASVNYLITTDSVIEQRNGVAATGGEFMFASTETLFAVFDYSDIPLLVQEQTNGLGTQYLNVTNFTMGTASPSFDHTDDSVWTLVSNDRWPYGTPTPVDALAMNANILPAAFGAPAGYPNYTDGNGIEFTLTDMRVFWGERFSGTDFLSDESLPASLPVPGSGNGSLALVFTNYDTDGTTVLDQHAVIGVFTPADVSVIPLPGAVWLFLSCLGALGLLHAPFSQKVR